MLEKMSEKLYAQLNDEITKITAKEADPFKVLSAVLRSVRESLKQLKEYILQNPFRDEAQQIWFFKHVKPKFYCLRIYYLEWYGIKTNLPAGDKMSLKAAYTDELNHSAFRLSLPVLPVRRHRTGQPVFCTWY